MESYKEYVTLSILEWCMIFFNSFKLQVVFVLLMKPRFVAALLPSTLLLFNFNALEYIDVLKQH